MWFVVSYKTRVLKFAQSVKKLNLFKMHNDGTDNPIKRQKIITRIYLILLGGMFFFSAHAFAFAKAGNKYIDS